MALKLVTAPTEEPVSLSDAKSYLRIDGTDSDAIITALIKAAREYCESFQNRSFITQIWEMTLDEFPAVPFKIPRPPLQSVVSITYKDKDGIQTSINTSDYIVDSDSVPGRIAFAYGKSWPSVTLQPVNAVKIRFTAGYGTAAAVPETVKQAMEIFIAHRYENPESEDVPKVVQRLLWSDRVIPI